MSKAQIQAELAITEELWKAIVADAADGTISEQGGAAQNLLRQHMLLPTTLMPFRTPEMVEAKDFYPISPVGDGKGEAPGEKKVHPDSLAAYRRLYGVYVSTKATLASAIGA